MGTPAPPRRRAETVSLKHIGGLNDYDVADALNAFARRVVGDGVSVEFAAGVASLLGTVPSEQARLAIEDLIAAHEGVESVVNNLLVAADTPARKQPAG
jgi:hypothetical protein